VSGALAEAAFELSKKIWRSVLGRKGQDGSEVLRGSEPFPPSD